MIFFIKSRIFYLLQQFFSMIIMLSDKSAAFKITGCGRNNRTGRDSFYFSPECDTINGQNNRQEQHRGFHFIIREESVFMRIAVTYDNGEIFQHFGHTGQFKIYTTEDDKVVSSEIIEAGESGHGALASMLGDNEIDVVICGGIGDGASNALSEQGIELCAGASGDADEAVEAFLRGELLNSGANCDHHAQEDEEECGHCDPRGCAGCSGCHSGPQIEGKNVGKICKVHYTGTFNDGTKFDSSYDRGEPLEFVCGTGMMILGFDKAVANMDVGETADIHLMPAEAYGEADPDAVFTIELDKLPGIEKVPVGERIYLRNVYGERFGATVIKMDDKTVTLDANHEMAGKELNFRIELVETRG